MGKFLSLVTSPAVLLYMFVVPAQIANGIYSAGEIDPPPAFTLIYALGFLWIIGWWLLNDSKERGVEWVLDMGLFLYIAWSFFMPYYLLKTRGAKGLLVVFGFAAVYAGALAVGLAVGVFMTQN